MAAKSSAPRFKASPKSDGAIWRTTGIAVVVLAPETMCE